MASTPKILGTRANKTGTGANVILYTVPASTTAVVSSFVVCNIAATEKTFRAFHCRTGETVATATDALFYDVIVPGNDTFVATIGITMNADDDFIVLGSDANVVFTLYGVETT